MRIDLSSFFMALAPSLTTKIVSQAFGSKAGAAFGQATGAPAIDLPTLKADAQPLVEAALTAARPALEAKLETAVDALIVKYVPAELRGAAEAEFNAIVVAPVEAWDIKL